MKFTCDEPAIYAGSNLRVFHDINYLKGDNYDIHIVLKGSLSNL
jgi:hypothetical protein